METICVEYAAELCGGLNNSKTITGWWVNRRSELESSIDTPVSFQAEPVCPREQYAIALL